jgi:hypothetical protein
MSSLQVVSSTQIKFKVMGEITALMFKGTGGMMTSSRIKDYKLLKMRLPINMRRRCCPAVIEVSL